MTYFRTCMLIASAFLLVHLTTSGVDAQQKEQDDQADFTPGVSTLILRPGQFELGIYSSYLLSKEFYNFGPPVVKYTGEGKVLSGITQFTLGISRKLNIGFDVQYSDIKVDYRHQEEVLQQSISGWSFGPRLRYEIISKGSFNLINQTFAYFPDSSLSLFSLGTQLIGTLRKNNFLWMAQLSGILPANVAEEKKRPFRVPLVFYSGYRINNTQLMPYLLIQYLPEFGSVPWQEHKYFIRRSSTSLGGGLQTALGRTLLYAFYVHPISSRFGGGFSSINAGIRFTTQ